MVNKDVESLNEMLVRAEKKFQEVQDIKCDPDKDDNKQSYSLKEKTVEPKRTVSRHFQNGPCIL